MKLRLIFVFLFLIITTLSYLLIKKSRRIDELEATLLNTIIMQVSSDAVMATYLISGNDETYYRLTEEVFNSLPNLVIKNKIPSNDVRIEKLKEWIARYYLAANKKPNEDMVKFLGEFLNREYSVLKQMDIGQKQVNP